MKVLAFGEANQRLVMHSADDRLAALMLNEFLVE
jgi:hypothetical protein